MFFPARPRPAGTPQLHHDDEVEIAWARAEIGVQGDDPIPAMFFRDEDRATPARIRKWIVFYAKVFQKIERYNHEHGTQFGLRLPLPLPNENRKRMPVDMRNLHTLVQVRGKARRGQRRASRARRGPHLLGLARRASARRAECVRRPYRGGRHVDDVQHQKVLRDR